jgi:CBS domain-containing protein
MPGSHVLRRAVDAAEDVAGAISWQRVLSAAAEFVDRGVIAMRKLPFKVLAAIGLSLLCASVCAADQEEALATITKLMVYAFILFVVVVAVGVYFTNTLDKRRTPLRRIFGPDDSIHSVGPARPVSECVRLMSDQRIGALVVMEGDKLLGIFTERDALTKVLAAGRDPGGTRVSDVMTKDPYCVAPTITVGEAMAVVTRRRFRHLPVVEDGRLLAIISSGDLTRWLVKDKAGEVQELVGVAAGT